jgi:two-component sensor histidine kinase
LEAKNSGNYVVITVRDDGRGLNREKILEKAKKNGLLHKDPDTMTDKEVFEYIFLPGMEEFISAIHETFRLYNTVNIDLHTLSQLLALLTNAVNAFNRLVKYKQDHKYDSGDFKIYQNAIVNLMNEYGELYERMRNQNY